MLTGLFVPTRGDVIIGENWTLTRHLDLLRGVLGVCPQDNRLWANLTVEEHLYIYAGIKGTESGNVDEEVLGIESLLTNFF
jgi:ATP-binding cassette subfamily A (ABC1) protein 3